MNSKLKDLLDNNEVVGHSTDTVYGLIAKLDVDNISKINTLKERQEDKPLQVLIDSVETILPYIVEDGYTEFYLKSGLKPGTSYLININDEFSDKYLLDTFHKTVLIRIPEGDIKEVLMEYKMLFASSANKHNEEPVSNLEEFTKVFPTLKGFGSEESNKSSKIVSLINKKEETLR